MVGVCRTGLRKNSAKPGDVIRSSLWFASGIARNMELHVPFARKNKDENLQLILTQGSA
jgi:hypothetical protein